MGAENDVFKLVSLRGPSPELSVDPGAISREPDVVRLVLLGRKWREPDQAFLAAVSTLPFMDEDVLRRTVPWIEAAEEFVRSPENDVLGTVVTVDGVTMLLAAYGSGRSFLEAEGRLVASWLAIRLRQRTGQQISDAVVNAHEAALRFAQVIRRVAAGRYRPADEPRLVGIPLVVPAAWRRYELRRDAPVGFPIVVQDPVQLWSTERDAAVRGARGSREALLSAVILFARRNRFTDNGVPVDLDITFMAALQGRLSADGQQAVTAAIQAGHGAGGTIDGLTDHLQAAAETALLTANRLCSRIRNHQATSPVTLPQAERPHESVRPSIQMLGWGDLMVIREELVGYEAREISHIENVLAGESARRQHVRRHTTQVVDEDETIRESTSEDELATTSRFELQNESSRSIATDFAVQAGVNTSGKYGLTDVKTSAAGQLSRSEADSVRSAVTTSQEIVSKAVDRTHEVVRELRRRMTTDSIRELTSHEIENTSDKVNDPQPRSGVYLWVEKVQRLQMYQYGKRLMVEFLVPEPGLSLIEAGQPVQPDIPKPPPLSVGPEDIAEDNYLCLAQSYGARDVVPPPPYLVKVGETFTGTPAPAADEGAEEGAAKQVLVPAGYMPVGGWYAATGKGRTDTGWDPLHVHLAVGGQVIRDSAMAARGNEDEDDDPGDLSYAGSFALTTPATTTEKGIPVTVRWSGADDNACTMNVYLSCTRSETLLAQWRFDVYQRLVNAQADAEARYRDAVAQARFGVGAVQTFGNRPAAVNRAVERDELQKWAIKLMRVQPFGFNAVTPEDGVQEIDPAAADDQAPIVRFFEDCFEWDQMTYLLQPYFWGRKKAWPVRQKVSVPSDPRHEAFLRAGSARVIVPITPGYESWFLDYMEAPPGVPEWDHDAALAWSPDNRTQRIAPTARDLGMIIDTSEEAYDTLWQELIEEYNSAVVRGSGWLHVVAGSVEVRLDGTSDTVGPRDVGRDIYVQGGRYRIEAVWSATEFDLDREFEGETSDRASYSTGAVARGEPWEVRVPTSLVMLSTNRAELSSLSG